MSPQLISAIPRLPSRDFDATAAIYRPFGFREIACYEQGYLILRSDGAELHFFTAPEDLDPAQSAHGAYIRIMNAARFGAAFAALGMPREGIPRYVPPSLRDWGMIEAYLIDPDGNMITFGAPMETAP